MELSEKNIITTGLDHLGIVAGVCKELKIAERIDEIIGNRDKRRVVSCGKAVVAMIINGLGFTGKPLYLTPKFFANKPVERLLGKGIEAEDLNDNSLGKALDEIAAYGATQAFAHTAFGIALDNQLLGEALRLDSTSMAMEGEYNQKEEGGVVITHGFAKQRPDLKQFIIQMAVTGPADIPIWQETLDGNTSDKKSFHETIHKVKAFQAEIKQESDFKWIADSALYSKDKLFQLENHLWISRVPETIKEAKDLLEKEFTALDWTEYGNGYKYMSFSSDYGEIQQRWLLVASEEARKRESKTFEKKLIKQEEALKKKVWHLENKEYETQGETERLLETLRKSYKFFKIEVSFEEVLKYPKKGRPTEGDKPIKIKWKMKALISRNEEKVQKMLNKKGRFILATNDLDLAATSDESILQEYKKQQGVERGFRFLKDPWFMLDKIFLKSQRRITALTMVMTLSLLVYQYAQYKIRLKLKEQGETVPNQVGKAIQNPTMRWVFQLMSGVTIVRIWDSAKNNVIEVVANLDLVKKKIIKLLGSLVGEIYGFT